MKLFALLSAGLVVVAASVAPTAASAQHREVRTTTTRVVHVERDRGWNNGRQRWGTRTVCRTERRRGHRERVCRKVRYRR